MDGRGSDCGVRPPRASFRSTLRPVLQDPGGRAWKGARSARGACNSLRKPWVLIAGLLIVSVWVSILARFRDAEPAVVPTPPDVRAWDMLGCLRVDVDAWDAPADSARPTFPPLWLLLADDFDPWGRSYDTYRAIPFSRDSVVLGATPYRWFTRADTVWLVWSENDARGGLALRRSGRDWAGRIGIRDPGADAQSNGIASAWQVNCWSLDRRRPIRGRR